MSVPQPPPGWPPRPMYVAYYQVPKRRSMPTEQTKLSSLTWLLLSTALLVASLVLPFMVPPDAHWLTGPTLLSYGPQLLGGESVGGVNAYLVVLTMLTATCSLGMLLGSARLLNRAWSVVLGVLASIGLAIGLFTSLILLVGAAAADATAGVAAIGLPLGYLGCLLSCFIPSVRDGWIK